MLADVLPHLRCPHCGKALALRERTVGCAAGHTFDVARQGYVSLLAGHAGAGTGDSAAMVAAREAFLERYAGLVALVAETAAAAAGIGRAVAADHHAPAGPDAASDDVPRGGDGGPGPGDGLPGADTGRPCVLDVGAGTGSYLAATLDALPDAVGVALDLSKPALRRAVRAHPRIGAVAGDAWAGLPLRDATAAVVLSVFAPRHAAEIARVLRPGGSLVVAAPTARHLRELVAALGLVTVDERKRERLDAALSPHLEAYGTQAWEASLVLDHEAVVALVGMGPSARHLDNETLRTRVAGLPDPVRVTASVTVSVHRRLAGLSTGARRAVPDAVSSR